MGACLPPLSDCPRTLGTLSFAIQGGFAYLVFNYCFQRAFRLPAGVSLLRLPIAAETSNGILTVSSIGFGSRLILRSRLTLIRLALIRKPWSFGEGVSRPLYRYLYLHLLFQKLQHASLHTFVAVGMLPYRLQISCNPTSSAPDLCPIIIHARPLD